MKAWKFLGGIVSEEDKPLLNDVWWWTIGFHNFVHQVLTVSASILGGFDFRRRAFIPTARPLLTRAAAAERLAGAPRDTARLRCAKSVVDFAANFLRRATQRSIERYADMNNHSEFVVPDDQYDRDDQHARRCIACGAIIPYIHRL